MAKSKISRKKLLKEPDEFITFTGRLIAFGRTYQNQLIGGLTAFFIILALISTVRYFSAKSEAEAALLLANTQTKYQEALSSGGAEDAFAKVESDFKRLFDEYSGKAAGRQARLIFADICFNAKKIDRAIDLYEVALKDWSRTSAIKNLILNSLGYAYESKDDFKKAVTYYEQVRKGSETIGKADAIYNLGRIYAKLDDQEKSKDAYSNLDKNYPDYVYAQIVKAAVANN